jgi:hypothetical protein
MVSILEPFLLAYQEGGRLNSCKRLVSITAPGEGEDAINEVVSISWHRCDLWEVLMPEDPGYTYDCHRNQMLPWNGYRSRLDRHVFHCFWVILHIFIALLHMALSTLILQSFYTRLRIDSGAAGSGAGCRSGSQCT